MKLYFTGDIASLRDGIRALADEYHFTPVFDEEKDASAVTAVQKKADTLSVSKKDGAYTVVYSEKIHFFRALGLLLQHAEEKEFSIEEKVHFTMNGPMYDVSQGNAVINIKTVKYILRRMAVMGLNMMMLYCEDSYDVEKQPWFGYMRARYTEADMRELDDYADMLGIEMIPCIQTLAHLVDFLKWPQFKDIAEDKECLLVGEEKTYAFVRDLIEAASRPFRTKRIHIGMDEAWRLGRGKYQDLHGVVPKSEIMAIHLKRVMQIVRELGLKPMMWSDMFFRAADPEGGYYNADLTFTPEQIAACPKDMQLVYWDYYHDDSEDFYLKFIDRHREFGEPIFAGGIWTWIGFAANYKKTFRTMNPALMACKKKGVKEVFVTVWGDNGTECSILATLLGLSLFAEHGYNYELTEDMLRERFEFCCGAKYDDFMALRYLDETPGAQVDNMNTVNPSKFCMWQDILGGLFDKNIEGLPLNAHYAKLSVQMRIASENNGSLNEFFEYNFRVAHALALKAEAGVKLREAYLANDREMLRSMADTYLPELRSRVAALRETHMRHWFHTYKAFGWDIMDMRYGSLLARIDSAVTLIRMYLAGEIDSLEELAEKRLPFAGKEGLTEYANYYGKIVSSSRISPNA